MAVAVTLGAMGVVPAAVADEPSGCDAEFEALWTQTDAATFEGRNKEKDERGLLDKIAAAEDKFDAGKATDADGKLADYQAKVEQLLSVGKLVDGASLLELADTARKCVVPRS